MDPMLSTVGRTKLEENKGMGIWGNIQTIVVPHEISSVKGDILHQLIE